MKKSTKKLARHLTALFAALAVGLGTLPAAAFAADAPEPIPEQPAIVGVESAQEEGQSDAVGTDAVGTDTVGTDETGTDTVGTDETGTGETGTDETGTDETGTDETETDETGTDETGTDETETGGTGTDETGTDETTPSEDAVLPTEPATQPEQPEETPAAGEAPATEEIPAEVKAFLNAVAKIPADITPDNAEEAAELIYGEVSEAYEALLGTEYEGRADVQEAAALYAAAIEAVDAALELNSVTFDKIPVGVGTTDPNVLESAFLTFEMWEADHTIPAVTVSGNYADADYVGEVLVNPDGKTATIDSGNLVFYTNYGIAVTTNWSENGGLPWIMQTPSWLDISLRADGGVLYVTFTAKPGARVGQTGIVKLNYGASWAVVTNNAFFGEKNGKAIGDIYYKVTVGDGTVTVPEKPEKPTDEAIQNFYSNKNIAVIVRCVDNVRHNGTLSRLAKGSYTIGEVEAYDGSNKNLSTDEWSWMCKVHVDQDYYLKRWHKNFGTKWGTHYLNDADKDVYAPFYYFKGGKCSYSGDDNLEEGWYCLTEDAPVYVDITHKKPAPVVTYTVIYTDGVVGEIVFANQVHEGKKAGDKTPSFEKADFGTITLDDGTVQPSRDGYTFQGWSPAVNPVVSADDADTNGVITYMATWQKNTSINDLTITKTADKDKAEIGETIKYTIKVENNSNTSATVKVVDKLPEKVDFVKVSDSDGGVYDKTTHTVTWENVTVPAHGSKQLLVWVKANASGTIENKATVTLDGQDKESDPAIVEVPKPDPGEAEYAVQWIDAANNTVLKSENRTGTVGTTVTVNENDKAYPGYTYVGDEDARNVLSATLEESGTVLKLYFTKDTENPGPGPDEPGKDQYNVTYKWTGLPEGHNETLPEGGKYEKGAEVTVDTNYSANKEVVIGEKTYVFSGWSTSDADIENGKFTMPNKDVTLIGTWTEKAENPGPGPDEPGKDQYNVTYKWTGLPENHNETLPEGGKYEEGETVTVDTSFVKGQEVIVGGKTYVFSGWDQTGSFAMPAEDVTINGSWSEKPVTPTPGPDPVDPTPGEPDDPTPPSGGYVPRPRPVTPPVVDVPEIDVPLVETPVVEFVEPEVPLTEAPELPEAEVPEEDVPLADIPKTGDSGSFLWAMLLALSAAGALALARKLRREK